jgi:hypothetical protein
MVDQRHKPMAAAEVAQASVSRIGSGAQTRSPEPPITNDAQVREIWIRMGSVYGHKWSSQYGEQIDSTWRRAMQSLPLERLKMALARCAKRKDPWPPSLTEFVALAEVWPEEVGAPDVDRAFDEACRAVYRYSDWHKWSHRCVYWAAVWTGLSDLADRSTKVSVRKEFDRNYQKALDSFQDLEEPPRGELKHMEPPPPDPTDEDFEAVHQMIAAAKEGQPVKQYEFRPGYGLVQVGG